MNFDPLIHQIKNQSLPTNPTDWNVGQQPNKKITGKEFRLSIPLLSQVVMILGVLVLMAGIITSRQLINQNTLNEGRAANVKADAYLQPTSSNLSYNQEKDVVLKINSNELNLSSVQFDIQFNPEYVSVSTVDYGSGSFPGVVKRPTIDNSTGHVTGALTAFDFPAGDLAVLTMTVKAKSKSGTTSIVIDPNIQITALDYDEYIGQVTGGANINIDMSGGTEPTPNVTPSPTPTTTPTTTPTATPDDGDNNPTLYTQFKMQGVNKTGVTVPVVISLRYKSGTNNDEYEVITYNQNLTSDDEGKFFSQGISLASINLNDIVDDQIDVFVKSPYSLVNKLGAFDPTQEYQDNQVTIGSSSQKILIMGDFVRGEVDGKNETNKINMLDISKLLGIYTQLETEVNDDNRMFDLDYNGIIDVFDVSIVMSNYTDTVIEGDNI